MTFMLLMAEILSLKTSKKSIQKNLTSWNIQRISNNFELVYIENEIRFRITKLKKSVRF